MPADVTWQAEDGAGHDGARSAHQVANTARVPAAPAKTPPPAALRTRAQPVAAAPEVLRARPAFKVKRQRLPHATAASVATQPQLHAASSIAPRPSASDEDFSSILGSPLFNAAKLGELLEAARYHLLESSLQHISSGLLAALTPRATSPARPAGGS
jgi:hypothetical protein